MSNTLLNQPIIFVGAPCSGVSLVSNLLQFHPELCWLDTHFENHPHSDFHHRLFRLTSSFRDYLYTEDANLKQKIQGNLWGAVPAFCLSFWQEATRDDIDFYRGFLLGKYASHVERYLVNETLCRRLLLSGKSRFLLRFVGPSRLGLLKSMFPTAKFVRVKRDPAATVNSILNQERWEYEGKNMLWWRGAYSLEELSNYQRIRRDPIASTAFQLNKICAVTHEEMKKLDIEVFELAYETFMHAPKETMMHLFDYCGLDMPTRVSEAIDSHQFHCSNKVLTLPATDINTIYQWCDSF